MPTISLTDEQVIDLVKQLSPDQQQVLLRFLLTQQWGEWVELSREGAAGARALAAKHNLSWDSMTEDERLDFIDDVVHEDRVCSG